jgi:aminoglycoside N3'-acetyltransferase
LKGKTLSIRRVIIKKIKNIIKFRKKIQRKFLRTINKNDLISDFKKIGMGPGMSVFVHSSLSNLGNIEGGAQSVVDSLKNVVGSQGTILMPGFTIRESMDKTLGYFEKEDKVFDSKKEEPLIGAIPRQFFHNTEVFRSIHPTHSVLAWGKKAKYITNGHEESSCTFGRGTPLHKLIETNSYIMGLGSDLGHVTFYHVLEDSVKEFPVSVYDDKSYTIKILLPNGEIKKKKYKAHCDQEFRIERLNCRWLLSYFRRYFIQNGGLVEGYIGNSKTWIIKADDMYRCIYELLVKGYTIYTPPRNAMLIIFAKLLKQQ